MKCPFCGKTLVRGKEKRYENKEDHCLNPNAETHPLRVTWVCDCEHSAYCFWDEDGGFYSGSGGYTFSMLRELFPSTNCHAAIGSWDEWFDKMIKFSHKIEKFMIFSKYKNSAAYKVSKFFYNPSKPKIAL